MLNNIHLTGDYVNLRPLVSNDAEVTFGWRKSARADLLNQGASSIGQQKSWIESRPDTEINFIIELVDRRPVGMLSLIDISEVHRRAEPGRFLIGDEVAVKGVPAAVEAMLLLYKYAFDTLKLRRLYGMIAAENKRMIKWQVFLGMKVEGRLRGHFFLDGHYQDAVYLGLTYDDYMMISLPKMTSLIMAGKIKNI